ncbi:hypothetical protein DIPPA_06323 [Diplonema papillatum]|nr:hypothetical protein DIPPA_06323 [Diplonema papillatum]
MVASVQPFIFSTKEQRKPDNVLSSTASSTASGQSATMHSAASMTPSTMTTVPPSSFSEGTATEAERSDDMVLYVCDPATKKKITLPFSLTHQTSGRVMYFQYLNTKTRRESHLCMLYQKGKCRSNIRCNQIHADRSYVSKLRQMFYESSGKDKSAEEPLTHQRRLEIVVNDPTNPSSKMVLPFAKTEETVGRQRFLASQQNKSATGEPPKDFGLCTYYMYSGSCKNGAECSHIHANREFLRYLQEGHKPCCPYHGDTASAFRDYDGKVIMVNKVNQKCHITMERLSTTKGLRELVAVPAGKGAPAQKNGDKPGSASFCSNRVCRLHQEKRCQYGFECANLHVCREYYALYANAARPDEVSLQPTAAGSGGSSGEGSDTGSYHQPPNAGLPGHAMQASAGYPPVHHQQHTPYNYPSSFNDPQQPPPPPAGAPAWSVPTGTPMPPPAAQPQVAAGMVTGMVLSAPANQKSAIPIITKEGPVPLGLFPAALQAAVQAAQIAHSMHNSGSAMPLQPPMHMTTSYNNHQYPSYPPPQHAGQPMPYPQPPAPYQPPPPPQQQQEVRNIPYAASEPSTPPRSPYKAPVQSAYPSSNTNNPYPPPLSQEASFTSGLPSTTSFHQTPSFHTPYAPIPAGPHPYMQQASLPHTWSEVKRTAPAHHHRTLLAPAFGSETLVFQPSENSIATHSFVNHAG